MTEAAVYTSLNDETPEGRSVIELAEERNIHVSEENVKDADVIPFKAQTRMSGLDLPNGDQYRKGAVDAIRSGLKRMGEMFQRTPTRI